MQYPGINPEKEGHRRKQQHEIEVENKKLKI